MLNEHKPHWNKTPDEWCEVCGEDWPCSTQQDQEFLAFEIERLGYMPEWALKEREDVK